MEERIISFHLYMPQLLPLSVSEEGVGYGKKDSRMILEELREKSFMSDSLFKIGMSHGRAMAEHIARTVTGCADIEIERVLTEYEVENIGHSVRLDALAIGPDGECYDFEVQNGMGDDLGRQAIEFVQEIGQYFNDGFAATDYATAQSMFLDGKSAMYYIGDWEQNPMLEKYLAGEIDYFLLPMVDGAVTGPNEYCANSGIGMAFNVETFDEKTKGFIMYLIEHYGDVYASKMQMSPMKGELPSDVEFTPLYHRIAEDMGNYGTAFMKPWDTYLDPATNTILQDNLLLLASGDMDAETFIQLVDQSIAENT